MPATSERQRRFMGAELARKRAGQKTQTGMTEAQLKDYAKKAKYNSKLESPKGDLGRRDDADLKRAFPRPIKHAGKEIVSSRELPYHPPQTGIDSKYGPGDKVC